MEPLTPASSLVPDKTRSGGSSPKPSKTWRDPAARMPLTSPVAAADRPPPAASSMGPPTSQHRAPAAPQSLDICEVASLVDLAQAVENRQGAGTCGAPLCGLLLRSLGAVGVVYGDIGTSPLYTLSSIYGEKQIPRRADLLGSTSCLVWTLTIIVVVKYIICVMQADHEGEGGIFALLLNLPKPASRVLVVMAAIGASMLIGDGMITPAMSVLSAFEGLTTGPLTGQGLDGIVVPATIVCLLLLFGAQPFGIDRIGRAFGPVMVIYFLAIAAIGINNILRHNRWEVFEAINPIWLFRYFVTGRYSGWGAFWKLGSVVLSVTGAEALFADLGHFGRKPIILSWFGLVYPSLVLGYLGQAAFLLDRPHLVTKAFWSSVPSNVYVPMMVLVTLATIIASQSLIAGCYSLIEQAVVLGLFPRVKTVHTDDSNRGQIFIPEVASGLCVCTILMVLIFQRSANMAGAYGIAVTSTFFMTTVLYFAVLRRAWNWSLWSSLAVVVPMGCIDLLFLFANMPKVVEGGWVPLAMGLFITLMMLTWQWGQQEVRLATGEGAGSVLVASPAGQPGNVIEVAGIFLLEAPLPEPCEASLAYASCPALDCLVQYTSSVPRLCLLLALDVQRDVPRVPEIDRLQLSPTIRISQGMRIVYARVLVGFAEPLAHISIEGLVEPALRRLEAPPGVRGPLQEEGDQELPVRYFVSQFKYRARSSSGIPRRLLIRLFRVMNTCCRGHVSFLDLPLDKVFLVGGVLEL